MLPHLKEAIKGDNNLASSLLHGNAHPQTEILPNRMIQWKTKCDSWWAMIHNFFSEEIIKLSQCAQMGEHWALIYSAEEWKIWSTVRKSPSITWWWNRGFCLLIVSFWTSMLYKLFELLSEHHIYFFQIIREDFVFVNQTRIRCPRI